MYFMGRDYEKDKKTIVSRVCIGGSYVIYVSSRLVGLSKSVNITYV